ncbi:hypothetical protein PVAP13_5NG012686 [Panicum virgatum]|uniref:Uncharacterized protein n=1 Tax=Panicum virgatum TaxID=38727 RepID=A0A8T0SAQ4_PANVG|nr:hypothetical protein PVAP13_5NG012686 [Panicum virgatum]
MNPRAQSPSRPPPTSRRPPETACAVASSSPPSPTRWPPDATLALASSSFELAASRCRPRRRLARVDTSSPTRRSDPILLPCRSSPPVARPGAPPKDEVQFAPVGARRRAPTKIQPEFLILPVPAGKMQLIAACTSTST